MSKFDKVDVEGTLVHETELAVLVDVGGNNVWLPKSQITYDDAMTGDVVTITLPEWLAQAKGVI